MSFSHKSSITPDSFDYATMVEQLHQLCEINSGSYHQAGLQSMLQALKKLFQPLADGIEVHPLPQTTYMDWKGNMQSLPEQSILLVRKRPHLKRRILLCGHMDTVFSKDHPFQHVSYLKENILQGPGVSDMKGGLIVMLHALTSFEMHTSTLTLGWDVAINADEEIGSLASAPWLESIASNYQAALVYEPALTPQGLFAKNRKGSGKFTLIATGKSAHAGRNFSQGRNAICYLASIIAAIDALNGKRPGVTINVGFINGGTALNVVPDRASAQLDIRIENPDDIIWVHQQFQDIISNAERKDYGIELHGHFGRPVKTINPATRALFRRVQQIGLSLGMTLEWEDSGGCCDGNNLSKQGLPVIDTLGVRGGNIHDCREYILLDSLIERSTLSALLMEDLAQGGLERLS